MYRNKAAIDYGRLQGLGALGEVRPPFTSALKSVKGQTLQVVRRWFRREVHFGPKTDLIPMLNPLAHASRLCNRAEEYGHAGSSECDPHAQASAVEQREADRGKAATATQTRLVDPDESR